MSQYRRMNLLKTLSKSDIDEVLDQYGADQPLCHPLMCGNEDELLKTSNGVNFVDAKLPKMEVTGLQEEWTQLFGRKNSLQQLKAGALNGNIGTDNYRSVCWRVFWECLSPEQSKWVKDVEERRKRYDEIRNKYVIDPYEKDVVDLEIHHPLSQAEDSVWHQYFQDNELRDTIMQDLDRLFPEIQFFQQDCVKSIILHILFCYARENPQVQYKQGMHEILAPLIYVMVLNGLVVKESNEKLSDDIKVIMDLTYLEHDAYSLFFNIMESIEPWYANLQPLKGNQTTAISKKLTRIQCYMLKRYDSALRDHLEKIEVTPQLYGIRWVRLLFGREFSLNRLLILWDAIFADGVDLVDYIFLAMLINLRGVLLQNDFNHCLGHLMKYPANTDTKYILKRAVQLKNKFTDTANNPVPVSNHTEDNISNVNTNGKPVFYSNRSVEAPSEQLTDPLLKYDTGMNPSMRPQRSNSLGKQMASIKNKVGNTPQIISRLSDSLKNKNQSRQFGNPSTVDALMEDHAHLQKQVSDLQTQMDKMSAISLFCGGKMDLYISILQQCLMAQETCGELEVHTFAGLKQVRDILKDGMENVGTIPDHEDDFRDIDEHIADASNKLLAESTTEPSSNPTRYVDSTTPLDNSRDSDVRSLVSPVTPVTLHSVNANTATSESCECDGDEHVQNLLAKDVDTASVDVLYFDHEDTFNNGNMTSDEKVGLVSGAKTNPPQTDNNYHVLSSAVDNTLTDEANSEDDLDTLIERIDTSRDLDPLSAFQIDLAACIDLSDDF